VNANAPTAAIRALGDPTRRAIFELLAGGPRPVGRIALELPVSRPAVSQHLKVLKEAGLVTDRPDGNRRMYELNPDGVEGVREYFDRFWDHALVAFKRRTEQRRTEQRRTEQRRTEQRRTEQRRTEQQGQEER
jgi:DNA-binding transcriptional ArsR family regulator